MNEMSTVGNGFTANDFVASKSIEDSNRGLDSASPDPIFCKENLRLWLIDHNSGMVCCRGCGQEWAGHEWHP